MPKQYEPTPDVRAGHSIAHIDANTFQQADPNFAPTAGLTYLMSVVTVPIVIGAIGIVAVLLLMFFNICCCFCCKPKSKVVSAEQTEAAVKAHTNTRTKWARICYATIFVIFITDCFIWLGNDSLTQSIHSLSDAITKMINLLATLATGAMSVANSSSAFQSAMTGTCSAVFNNDSGISSGLDSALTSLIQSANSVSSLTTPIVSLLQLLRDQVEMGTMQKDQYIGAVFGVFFVLCLFNIASVWFCHKGVTFVVNLISYVFIILLIILCTVTMILVIVFGDFCMDPAGNILQLMAGSTANTVEYYTSCQGTNQFETYATQISHYLDVISDNYISSISNVESSFGLGSGCSSTLTASVVGMTGGLSTVFSQITCGPINDIYNTLVNESFCTYGYSGLYKIWGDMYFLAFFVFLLMCFVTHYFRYAGEPVVQVSPQAGGSVEMTAQGDQRHQHQHGNETAYPGKFQGEEV